jgi:hypothetical protein
VLARASSVAHPNAAPWTKRTRDENNDDDPGIRFAPSGLRSVRLPSDDRLRPVLPPGPSQRRGTLSIRRVVSRRAAARTPMAHEMCESGKESGQHEMGDRPPPTSDVCSLEVGEIQEQQYQFGDPQRAFRWFSGNRDRVSSSGRRDPVVRRLPEIIFQKRAVISPRRDRRDA